MKFSDLDTQTVIDEAAAIAKAYLAGHSDRDQLVVRRASPEELLEHLDLAPPQQGCSVEQLLSDVRSTLHYSVRTGHPGFSNQLFGDQDLAGLLGEWMTALLNTSMYTFEVAPVFTLMEQAMMRHMCGLIGWSPEEGEGVLTPGGSIANLMAMLAARNASQPGAKVHGIDPGLKLVAFMSEEAHYSTERAASVLGLGSAAVVKVASDGVGRMQPAALEQALEAELAAGRRPFFVCATASTTVAGAFDPIPALADIADRFDLWLHVDGACGGGVLLSPRHRDLMRGVERADSVTWNPHKMMGVPLACSALFLRERGRLAKTNAMGADYLYHEGSDAARDLGDLSLQCGRRVDVLKLWLSWRAHGDEGHALRIDGMFEHAAALRRMIGERDHFALVREPEGCNTCFQFMPPSLRAVDSSPERDLRLGKVTIKIRERLRDEGRILTNYAPIDGVPAFRHVSSNLRATDEDLKLLLDEIELKGADL